MHDFFIKSMVVIRRHVTLRTIQIEANLNTSSQKIAGRTEHYPCHSMVDFKILAAISLPYATYSYGRDLPIRATYCDWL